MKTKFRCLFVVLILLALSTLDSRLSTAIAQGTSFTYQGRLNDGTNPANGIYDFQFAIYAAASGGAQQGNLLTNSATAVSNGLFTVTLDFGSQFPGANRWLEIGVRTNGGGAFTTLAPRQPLTPTPYAITASNVTGVLPSAGLSGTYGAAVILNNAGNSFAGNGSSLVNLNANNLASGTVPATALGNAWKTTGNVATIPGANFIGTTDNEPLDLRVNNARAIHVQPVAGAAPTIVGGSSSNSVDLNVKGAVIGGGDNNFIGMLSDYSIVLGGNSNQIVFASLNSTIGGGLQNTLVGNDHYSIIAGGEQNQMDNVVFASSIGGGEQNDLQTFVQLSSIVGGSLNQIQYLASYSSIGGGQRNLIQTNAAYSALGGGLDNSIGANYSSIGSGFLNNIATNADYSAIAGGSLNIVQSFYSAIGGGYNNTIWSNASYDFIGGGTVNNIQPGANSSTIGGGLFNAIQAGAQWSVISGGDNNHEMTNASFAVIGGGSNNTIDTNAQYASIVGGQLNTISPSGHFSAIGGGKANMIGTLAQYATIAGGGANSASGNFSTVSGGAYNNAVGDYSSAAGTGAKAYGNRSFVWNSFPNPNYVTGTNEFFVFAENGFSVDYDVQRVDGGGDRWVYIGKGTGGTFGTVSATISTWTTAYLSDGGAWVSASDRGRKQNFATVDPRSVLEKVASLPIQTWNYTNESPALRHLGPVSQDFHAAFGLNGEDDKHIADVDEGGVALAAIQGLNEKVEVRSQNAEVSIRKLEAENAELKQSVDELKAMVKQLAAQK